MKSRPALIIVVLVILGLLWSFHNLSPVTAAPPLQGPETVPSLGSGAALWLENCAPCHGISGRGDGEVASASSLPPPDLTDTVAARRRSLSVIFDTTKNGRLEGLMPPWGNVLSDQEIWDVSAYVWSLANPVEDRRAGAEVFAEACAACHGETGQGDGPQASGVLPDLSDAAAIAGQSEADWLAGLEATFDGVHAVAADLSQDERWQALAYARSLSFDIPARDGTLSGRVINATLGQAQGDIPVTLHVMRGQSEVETFTTQAGDDGAFTFSGLDTDHSLLYEVEASYNGLTYFADDVAVFTPDAQELAVEVKVYETTNNDAAITIKQMHQILTFNPEALLVLQLYVFANNGDRTYVGTMGADGLAETVRVGVPVQAMQVSVPEAGDFAGIRRAGENYVSDAPVIGGGELQVVVTYAVPRTEDALTLAVPALYDVEAINVLVQDQGASLESEQLTFVEQRMVQGDPFDVYRGQGLQAGQSLTVRLSNLDDLNLSALPASASSESSPRFLQSSLDQAVLLWSILGLGLVATLFGLFYPRLRPQPVEQISSAKGDLLSEQERLLFALARLDETYERGELASDVYRQAREGYKAKLRAVIERLRAAESSEEGRT